jgi:predicted permease
MTTIISDIKYAFRQLRKSPGFTAVAVLSLAFGIGANTAIFSLLNAVLLRSLPVHNAHELCAITWDATEQSTSMYSGGDGSKTFPYPAYETFRDNAAGFSDIFGFSMLYSITAVTPIGASTTNGLMVTGNYFSGYGAHTLIGRTIGPEDDQANAEPVTVISYRAWEKYFGLDPNVIGQTVALNKAGFTIIGVLPRGYTGPISGYSAEFYVPVVSQPQLKSFCSLTSNESWWLQIMARRMPQTDKVQAQTSLNLLFNQFLKTSRDRLEKPQILLLDAKRGLGNQSSAQPLWALQGLVSLVLLIACANLASLLLAQGAARRHEMTVRAAMGAGRWRLMRQSLTESFVLSLAGAGIGLMFATWIKNILVGFLISMGESFNVVVNIDASVLAFTVAVAGFTTILCGLIPAWHAGRVNPSAGLKDSGIQTAPRLRLGKVLVAAQVGLSVLLVFGTGLLIQTLVNLYQVDPGFDTENLLVFRLNPGQAGYEGHDRISYFDQVREAISGIPGIPGIRSVAFSSVGLLSRAMEGSSISIPGRNDLSDKPLNAHRLIISDGFFETMGIRLLGGRDFNASDNQGAVHTAIVNETFARSFFPDSEVLGQTFKIVRTEYQIVGLCSDAYYNNLRQTPPPTMYFPYRQQPGGRMTFEVRSVLPSMSLVPAVRKLISNIDRNIPLENVATQKQVIKRSIMEERLFAILCGVMTMLAITLSCIGLYGLMAYNVARRVREMGIRLALGARPQDVAWPILREALILTAFGMVIGLPLALALTRLAHSAFFGIKSYDPLTVVGSIILLLGVAALSAWIPARRAAKVDPMEALRYE